MPDEITPALTKEQWKNPRAGWPGISSDDPDALHEEMAVANDALPDDDPRKITRADVERLQAAIDIVEGEFGDTSETAYHCRQLAAKLAALLPPDTDA